MKTKYMNIALLLSCILFVTNVLGSDNLDEINFSGLRLAPKISIPVVDKPVIQILADEEEGDAVETNPEAVQISTQRDLQLPNTALSSLMRWKQNQQSKRLIVPIWHTFAEDSPRHADDYKMSKESSPKKRTVRSRSRSR
jgi:hypothetical protein